MSEVLPGQRLGIDTRRIYRAFRPTPDGKRIAFGGRSKDPSRGAEQNGEILRMQMVDLFPMLADTRVTHSWGGYVAFTFDFLPHLGRSTAFTTRWASMRRCNDGALPRPPDRPLDAGPAGRSGFVGSLRVPVTAFLPRRALVPTLGARGIPAAGPHRPLKTRPVQKGVELGRSNCHQPERAVSPTQFATATPQRWPASPRSCWPRRRRKRSAF